MPLLDEQTPVRAKSRRWLLILMAVGVLLVVLAARSGLRERAALRETAAVIDAGGYVWPILSLHNRIQHAWHGADWTEISEARVKLSGPRFDDVWLREHRHLSDLNVGTVQVEGDTGLSDAGLAEFIDRHSLRAFFAHGANVADAAFAALARQDQLMHVRLDATKLTDDRLAKLPLERLVTFGAPDTGVTSEGMQALQRGSSLEAVLIDGRQATEETLAMLDRLPRISWLGVQGPGLDDEVARRLQRMERIERLHLDDYTISREAFDALFAAQPRLLKPKYMPRADAVMER